MGYRGRSGGAGSGFQLFTQIDNNSGVYADAAARDVYFGANPSELARLDADESLIIKILDNGSAEIAYQQRVSMAWVDVTSLVQGETGATGATGNSFLFSSIGTIGSGNENERDGFFSIPGKSALLTIGQPIVVHVGDDKEATYLWSEVDTPATYVAGDEEKWILSSKEINSGSLFLGQDGAKVSSASQVLGFTGADGIKRLITGSEYNDDGSHKPEFWTLNRQITVPIAGVFDTVIPVPPGATVPATNDETLRNFTIRPATVGTVRIQTWLGNSPSGPQIVDIRQEVVGGDIGNELIIEVPNDILVLNGQDTHTVISGVELYGGLQTTGPLVGLNVGFANVDVQLARKDSTESTLVDFVRLNRDLNTVGVKPGGLIVASDALAEVTTVTSQVMTPGVAGVSNPVVNTVGLGTFSPNQIVSYIPNDDTPDANEGFYEVVSHVGNALVVAGIGITGLTDVAGFRDQFVPQRCTGTFRRVALAGIRTSIDGVIEHIHGDVTPLIVDEVVTFAEDRISLEPLLENGTAAYALRSFDLANTGWLMSLLDTGIGNPPIVLMTAPEGMSMSMGTGNTVKLTHTGTDFNFQLQGAQEGVFSISHADGGQDVLSRVYGVGDGEAANQEFVQLGFVSGEGINVLETGAEGTGVRADLDIRVPNLTVNGSTYYNPPPFDEALLASASTVGFGASSQCILYNKTLFSFGGNNTVHAHDVSDPLAVRHLGNQTNEIIKPIQSYSAVSGIPSRTRCNSIDSYLPKNMFPVIAGGSYTGLREVLYSDPNGQFFDIDIPFVGDSLGTTYDVEQFGDYAATRRYGDLVYSVSNDNELFIYKIMGDKLRNIGSLPNNPHIASSRDIIVHGNYAYWICANAGSICGILVLDVTDPTDPVIVNEIDLSERYFKAEISGNVLYVTGANASPDRGFVAYDLTDPVNPKFLSEVNSLLGANLAAIEIKGNYAYLLSFSLSRVEVIDISDPSLMVIANTFTVVANPTSMGIFGNYLVVTTGTGVTNIGVYNITNPLNVSTVEILDIAPYSGAGKPLIEGNLLHVPTTGGAHLIYNLQGDFAHSANFGNVTMEEAIINRRLSVSDDVDVGGALTVAGPVQLGNGGSVDGYPIANVPTGTVVVRTANDLPAPDGGFIDLVANTTYRFVVDDNDAIPYVISIGDTLRFPDNGRVNFSASNSATVLLQYVGTGDMIFTSPTYNGTMVMERMLLSAPLGTVFNMDGIKSFQGSFLSRVQLNSTFLFGFDTAGKMNNLALSYNSGGLISGAGGLGKGLVVTNSAELLINDLRFFNWGDVVDTTFLTINGTTDALRLTNSVFGTTANHAALNLTPTLPDDVTTLISGNEVVGLGKAYEVGASGTISALSDVTTAGTVNSVTNVGGFAQFNGGSFNIGEYREIVNSTFSEPSYNGKFFAVSTSATQYNIVTSVGGTPLPYVAGDSGIFNSEGVLVSTPSTTGLSEGDGIDVHGTINADGRTVVGQLITDTSFVLNRVYVADESPTLGTWDAGSLTSASGRINSSGNVGIPTSRQIAAVSAKLVTDATVVTFAEQFEDFNLESVGLPQCVQLASMEGWTLMDQTTGEVRCDVPSFQGTLDAVISYEPVSGSPEVEFHALKNGVVLDDIKVTSEGATGSTTTLPIKVPLTAVKGDLFRLQLANNAGTQNITVRRLVMTIQ